MPSLFCSLLVVLCLMPVVVCAEAPPPKDVSPLLGPVIQKYGVPCMAAAVVRRGETVALGAAGVRTRGKSELVDATDQFHIGSEEALAAQSRYATKAATDKEVSVAGCAMAEAGFETDGLRRYSWTRWNR